jgi:hypothetical protein
MGDGSDQRDPVATKEQRMVRTRLAAVVESPRGWLRVPVPYPDGTRQDNRLPMDEPRQ